MRRFVFSFTVVINLLLLDQVVKAAAIQKLKGSPPQGQVWPLAAFAAVAFALLVWKRKSVFPRGVWGLVAEHLLYAGILGNLIDRLYYRFVVDMFDFHWGVHHFPCFNVADSCITVAAGILIACSLFTKSEK